MNRSRKMKNDISPRVVKKMNTIMSLASVSKGRVSDDSQMDAKRVIPSANSSVNILYFDVKFSLKPIRRHMLNNERYI